MSSPGFRSLTTWFARLPAVSRGAAFMVASCAGFAVMMALVRLTAAEIHPFVAAFFRNLLGVVYMLPWLAVAGLGAIKSGRWQVHGLRAMFGLGAMLSLFLSLSLLPLAEVTALTFSAPLFATIGAAAILGETVRVRRWTATLIGFVGVLIILRPGLDTVRPQALVALTAAIFIAAAMLSVKSLSQTENPNAMVFIMGLLMTPASAIPAAAVWTTPSWPTFGWLMLMGLAATFGQICLTRAFASAEVSAVLPLDFSRLIFVAVLGYLMFGERPDGWTLVGAAVILGAAAYIARREAQLGRSRAPAPPPAH